MQGVVPRLQARALPLDCRNEFSVAQQRDCGVRPVQRRRIRPVGQTGDPSKPRPPRCSWRTRVACLSSWSASRSSSRSTLRSSRLGARMCNLLGTERSVAPAARALRRRGHAHPNFRRCARSRIESLSVQPFQELHALLPGRGVRQPGREGLRRHLESEIAKRRANFVSRSRRPCAMLSRTARRLRPALSRARRAHTQSHAASTNRAAQLAAAAAGTAAAAVLLYQSSPRAAPPNTRRRVQGVVVAQRGGRLRARRDARRRRVQRGAPRPPPEDGQAGGGEGDPARAAVGGEHPPRGGRAAPRRDAPRDREARGLLRVADAPLHRDGVRRRRRALRPPGDGGRVLGEGRGGAPPAARGRGGAAPRAEAVPRRHQAREFALHARRPAQARRLWALHSGEEGRGAADEGHVGQLAARGLLQVVRRHARRRHVGDRRRRVHHARRLPPLRLRRRRHRHAGARAIPPRNSRRAIRGAQF